MSVGPVFVGDVGTQLLLDCGQDVSASTVRKIRYLKPDGTSGYWDADLDDGLEKIYCYFQAEDIDLSGTWKFQSYLEMPTWTGHGQIAVLKVYDIV